MNIIQIIGMPGSGKTTVAQALLREFLNLFQTTSLYKIRVGHVETSAVIASKNFFSNDIIAPAASSNIAAALKLECSRYDLTILSGIRELFLWQQLRWCTSATVYLDVPSFIREGRYKECGKGLTAFNKAESRVTQLKFSQLVSRQEVWCLKYVVGGPMVSMAGVSCIKDALSLILHRMLLRPRWFRITTSNTWEWVR